jgi:hypothetical protein
MLKNFPGVKVDYCYFHYAQCYWKNVSARRLKNLYKKPEVKRALRCILALAFVRQNEVHTCFALIETEVERLLTGTTDDNGEQLPAIIEEEHREALAGRSSQETNSDLTPISGPSGLLPYFKRNFVQSAAGRPPVYPIYSWSVHDAALTGLPKSNNAQERWNREFGNEFNHANPTLSQFVLHLKKHEEWQRVNFQQ